MKTVVSLICSILKNGVCYQILATQGTEYVGLGTYRYSAWKQTERFFKMIGSEVDVPCLVKSRSKDTYTQNLVSVNEAKSVCSMLMDEQKK
jgi:hypothetical protein